MNYYVLKKVSSPLYLLLFINPVFLDFSLSQQRNFLCFLILVLSLSFTKRTKYFLILPLPLIHSLSALLIPIFFLSGRLSFFKKKIMINILIIIFCFLLSLFIAFGRVYLNGYTDDARFYDYEVQVNSITYIMPWISYLGWFILGSKVIDKNYILTISFLSIYLFLTVFEFYGVRFLAMSIPFLIANIKNLKYHRFFVFFFVIHQSILLFFWLKIS